MLVNKDQILTIIPQRPPFVMIDGLVNAESTGFESIFLLTDNLILKTDQVVSENSLIENVAQTCAAGFGYLAKQMENTEPKIGFIGAVTKLKVLGQTNIGDVLNTKVEILQTFENIHLIQGNVFVNENLILSCQMKIVEA